MIERILPDKPIKFSRPNIAVDEVNLYIEKVENEEYPFYRVTIIALDSSGKQVGLLDVLYNYRYIIIENSRITDEGRGRVYSILYGLDHNELRSESDYINAITDVILHISEPGVSSEYLNALRKASKSINKSSNYYLLDGIKMPKISLSPQTATAITRLALSSIPGLVTIGYLVYDFMKSRKAKKIEDEASEAQQKAEAEIFKNAVVDKSIPVVANLVENIELFVRGNVNLNGLLIVGKSGVGKTFTVKKVLYDNGYIQGKSYGYIRIASDNIWDFIYYIYDNRDRRIVVIDDVDILFNNQLYHQIMLQLLESSPIRVVEIPPTISTGYTKTQKMKVSLDRFLVKSKYILLLNKELKDIPANIRTRCLLVNYHVDDETAYKIIRSSLANLYPDIPLRVKEDILFKVYQLMKSIGLNISYRQFDLAVTYYRTFGDDWYSKFELALKSKE